MDFEFLKKLWCRVGGRDQSKNFGFIKRVDKGWITTMKDLEKRDLEIDFDE